MDQEAEAGGEEEKEEEERGKKERIRGEEGERWTYLVF